MFLVLQLHRVVQTREWLFPLGVSGLQSSRLPISSARIMHVIVPLSAFLTYLCCLNSTTLRHFLKGIHASPYFCHFTSQQLCWNYGYEANSNLKPKNKEPLFHPSLNFFPLAHCFWKLTRSCVAVLGNFVSSLCSILGTLLRFFSYDNLKSRHSPRLLIHHSLHLDHMFYTPTIKCQPRGVQHN